MRHKGLIDRIKYSTCDPLKGACIGILLAIPIWAVLILTLIKYKVFGIVLISVMMVLFGLMSIIPLFKKY